MNPLLLIDWFGLFYIGLILFASLAVAFLSYGYLKDRDEELEEYYLLLMTASLGAMIIAVSTHFVAFFLGLEIMTISLYGMVAYLPQNKLSLEAGIKYLVLAGTSAGFLLFGMALVYAELGTLDFVKMATMFAGEQGSGSQIGRASGRERV